MHLKTLIAVQAITLPVGFSTLDAGRALVLALLMTLSIALFIWMGRASHDHTRRMAKRRLSLRRHWRSDR